MMHCSTNYTSESGTSHWEGNQKHLADKISQECFNFSVGIKKPVILIL